MLTAGLGVSEMMIGWDNVAKELGGVTPVLLSSDAVDIPLFLFSTRLAFTFFLSCWVLAWVVLLQLCPCCMEASSVSRGDSVTLDWWAELWMATLGTCCHDDGMRICWVPVGQAC